MSSAAQWKVTALTQELWLLRFIQLTQYLQFIVMLAVPEFRTVLHAIKQYVLPVLLQHNSSLQLFVKYPQTKFSQSFNPALTK